MATVSNERGSFLYRTILVIVLLLTPFMSSASQASSSSLVAAVLTGLNFPVSLKFAPDGRIFFTEKDTGNIRIVLSNGTLLTTPFANVTPLFNGGESGLLGLALDPAFSSNGYVYVYYTDRDAQSYTHGHIRRYTAVGNTGTNPVDIFSVTSSAPGSIYHNGGYIKFGPDGKLYAQVGEFHQDQNAQDPSATQGKILRMNPDGTPPSDNPDPSSLVYATGFRNGFGFDFDPSNGRFISTMVGPTSDDKILIIVKGGNYGWPTCVGVCHDPRFIDPIVDFTPVVTPTGIATVAPNVYYFGEWNTGYLMRLELNATGKVVSMNQVYTQTGGIVAVEMGPNGLLYITNPDGIYTYQVGAPIQTPSANSSLPLIIALLTIGTATAVFFILRASRKRRAGSPSIGPSEMLEIGDYAISSEP